MTDPEKRRDVEKGLARRVPPSAGTPRDKPRDKVDAICKLTGSRGRTLARVRDLTEGGFRIFSPKAYEVGDELAVELLIPGFTELQDFKAEVRWIDMAGSESIYEIGCAFLLTPKSRQTLQNLLWEFHSGNVTELQRKPDAKKTIRHVRKR
jgi:Tfp pilus assembly protein PilZ